MYLNNLAFSTLQLETPYPVNKWEYLIVTWKADAGLSLYMDGKPVASSEAMIAQKGEHLQDASTHLAVGRNTAGPPYGNTKMTVASLVFFDHHVRASDAQKISMYYWSSGKFYCCVTVLTSVQGQII